MVATGFRTGVAGIAVALGLSGCGLSSSTPAPQASTGPITLGTSLPLTGPASADCAVVSSGSDAWFSKINASGGVNGRQIKVDVQDDGYAADKALANAKQFGDENVLAIFGGCGTINGAALNQYSVQNKIPYLFPVAVLPDLANNPNAFMLFPLYQQSYTALVRAAFKDTGPGSVYFLVQQVPGADAMVTEVQKTVEKGGGKFLGTDQVTLATTDLTPILLRIKAANPDYIITTYQLLAKLFVGMKAQGSFPNKKVLANGLSISPSFIAAVGDDASRVLAVSATPTPDSPEAKDCVAALNAANPPVKVTAYSIYGCGAAQVLVAGLKAAGPGVDRASLVKALSTLGQKNKSAVFSDWHFSATDHFGVKQLYLFAASNGQLKQVGTTTTIP